MISTYDYSSVLEKIKLYSCEQLIKSQDWNIISNDIILVLECMKKDDFVYFEKINPDFYNYEEVCYLIFNCKNPPIHLISETILSKKSFIYKVLNDFPHHFSLISEKFLNPSILNWFFNQNKNLVIHTSHLSSLNNEMVEILLHNNYLNFQFLPEKYRNSLSVFKSISEDVHPDIFKFAGEHILKNPYIVQSVIKRNPSLYQYVDESLKIPQYFIRLLAFSSSILEFAPSNIKDNEVCVLESISKKPENLIHASKRLLSLSSFAYQVCSKMNTSELKNSFQFWDYSVRNNKEMITSLLYPLSEADCIEYISNELKNDRHFMKEVILQDIKNCQFLGEQLNTNLEYIFDIMEIMKKNILVNKSIYEIFEFLPDKLFESPLNLIKIYNKFKPDFENFIYPKIKYKNTEAIKELNNSVQLLNNGIVSYFEKMKLYHSLEKTLSHKSHHEVQKI